MRRALLGFVIAALSGLVLAVDYRVNSEGGPETLAQEVREAFAAWQELEPGLEASESEDAATLIRYGGAEQFGPDTYTLTVQRQAPERALEVLVNPSSQPERATVLLHETGLLLGLSPGDAGVMNPAIGEVLALGESERAELEASASFATEDIDRSGSVDFYDLVALGQAYGQTGVNLRADLNEDGVVDRADLELLREAYTFGPPSPTPPQAPEEPAPLEDLPEVPGPEDEGEATDTPNPGTTEPGEETEEQPEADPEEECVLPLGCS